MKDLRQQPVTEVLGDEEIKLIHQHAEECEKWVESYVAQHEDLDPDDIDVFDKTLEDAMNRLPELHAGYIKNRKGEDAYKGTFPKFAFDAVLIAATNTVSLRHEEEMPTEFDRFLDDFAEWIDTTFNKTKLN